MKYAQHTAPVPNDLVTARTAHLVRGQLLYLKDPRRTPVVVTREDPQTASFAVRVSAFEGAGAEWVFALWDVSKFLVRASSRTLTTAQESALTRRVPELCKAEHRPARTADRAASRDRIATLSRQAANWLKDHHPHLPADCAALVQGTGPHPDWSLACQSYLSAWGLSHLDEAFAAAYASHPNAGECIKAHRMALAHLGLCAFDGMILRDPDQLSGNRALEHRGAHILHRLAFVNAMFSAHDLNSLTLYRAISNADPLEPPRNTGFVSTTLQSDVADALFAAREEGAAAKFRQNVPLHRVFMTYFETPLLSAHYAEAEVILLFDADNPLF